MIDRNYALKKIARVSIKQLRADAPKWKWTAEHQGLGWRYIGTQNEKQVTVYATSSHCGPQEDDFCTTWRVDDGVKSTNYISWWIEQSHDKP